MVKDQDADSAGENGPGESKKTKWSSADEAMLVETLAAEKANGNWGDNNPKPVAWTAVVNALRGSSKGSQSHKGTLGLCTSLAFSLSSVSLC